MKTNTSISLLLAAAALFSLSSCVVPMDDYAGGGYGGGYSSYGAPRGSYSSPGYSYAENDFYYYNGGAYPSYYNPSVYGSYSVGYSYYRGSSVCPICHHRPCTGHGGHYSTWSHPSNNNWAHHDNDDHHSSGSSSHSSSQPLYIHNGGGGGAQGAHTKEWFVSHGYAPSRLEKTDDHGHSTKKNDHDEDDKKKHHH